MQEQTCSNCKHFFQHFVKRNIRFSSTNFGQCKNRKEPFNITANKPCKHFESIDLAELEEANQTLIKAAANNLNEICRRLNELNQILP